MNALLASLAGSASSAATSSAVGDGAAIAGASISTPGDGQDPTSADEFASLVAAYLQTQTVAVSGSEADANSADGIGEDARQSVTTLGDAGAVTNFLASSQADAVSDEANGSTEVGSASASDLTFQFATTTDASGSAGQTSVQVSASAEPATVINSTTTAVEPAALSVGSDERNVAADGAAADSAAADALANGLAETPGEAATSQAATDGDQSLGANASTENGTNPATVASATALPTTAPVHHAEATDDHQATPTESQAAGPGPIEAEHATFDDFEETFDSQNGDDADGESRLSETDLLSARIAATYTLDDNNDPTSDLTTPDDLSVTGPVGGGIEAAAARQTPHATATAQAYAPPPVADQVAEAIANRIEQIDDAGNLSFEVQLDPPELGRVDIRIERVNDRLVAHVAIADEAARQMIQQQMPKLQETLREQGIQLHQFDVSHQQSSPQQQQHSDQRHDQRPHTSWSDSPSPMNRNTGTVRVANGRLDIRA
ncbi:MAG: flagellar hook-length control protein FliK [Pirellulaceae bacterium]